MKQLVGPKLERPQWDKPSQVQADLRRLPLPKGKIVASIYGFRDLTGQYKPAPSSGFSTAVSQGASAILLKVVRDSGWFAPLEREGLQDLLTERKIIRAAAKTYNANYIMKPLLGANILFEGGIIGYESNVKTGGAGAKYFGIGGSEQYRMDQVTVNLRIVDVNSGSVLNSVTVTKSILSRSIQGGIFRYVRFKRLLEVEAGYTRNEPVQLCLTEAIQTALIKIIVEGVENNSWSLADAAEREHPLIHKYGTGFKMLRVKVAASKPSMSEGVPSAPKKVKPKMAPQGKPFVVVPAPKLRTQNIPLAPNKSKKVLSTPDKGVTKSGMASTVSYSQAGQYMIELISSTSAMEVLDFAKDNNLDRSLIKYVHYEVMGEDRFSLLYGRYEDELSASEELESLPPQLRVFKPWIRDLRK